MLNLNQQLQIILQNQPPLYLSLVFNHKNNLFRIILRRTKNLLRRLLNNQLLLQLPRSRLWQTELKNWKTMILIQENLRMNPLPHKPRQLQLQTFHLEQLSKDLHNKLKIFQPRMPKKLQLKPQRYSKKLILHSLNLKKGILLSHFKRN